MSYQPKTEHLGNGETGIISECISETLTCYPRSEDVRNDTRVNYWLMKSEPQVYSVAELQRERRTIWEGVRNYQARNFLREMKPGDLAFFYHSNTTPPGIVGLMRVIETGIVDPTQFDPSSLYYDAKSTRESPRWQTVKVEFVEAFPTILSLEMLKQEFNDQELWVVRRGNRLSVIPVEKRVAQKIIARVHQRASSVVSS